jgi:hypothetical protein
VGAVPLVKVDWNHGMDPPGFAQFNLTDASGELLFRYTWDSSGYGPSGSVAGSPLLLADYLQDLGEPIRRGSLLKWTIASEEDEASSAVRKSGRIRVRYAQTAHASDLVEGVEDRAVGEALRGLQPRLRDLGYLAVQLTNLEDQLVSIGDLTMALRIELLDADIVVASAVAWWADANRNVRFTGAPGAIAAARRDAFRLLPSGETIEFRNANNVPHDRPLTLRLTGDADVALRDFNCRRYWKGRVMLPVGSWR